MIAITANELKQKGVSALSTHEETLITIHGKNRFVVLDINEYHRLREAELAMAVLEAKQNLKNGDFYQESIEAHIKRITE